MNKKNVIVGTLSSILITGFVLFWSALSNMYLDPLAILTLNLKTFYPIFLLLLSTVIILFTSTLFAVLKITPKITYTIYLPGCLISLLFFKFNILILSITISIFLSLLLYDVLGKRELGNHIKISISHIFSRNASSFITALALILSFGYYPFTADQIRNFKPVIPEKVYNIAADIIVKNIATINEPKQSDKDSLEEVSKNLLGPLKKQLEERLNTLIDVYRRYLPAMFAVSLFATIKLFSPLITLFSLLIATIIITLLKILGILTINKVSREVEEITFS